ncbi:sulfatase [Saccharopolyspora taberi]|uniref:Sulfatase n=1 Tax=Saccharopolyspora taberi TaxID=60895 RepID=A0ABN3VHI4_9PSEU
MSIAAVVLLGISVLVAVNRPRPQERPNIVVVMTDDQTVEQMQALPAVADLAREGAVSGTNLAAYPLCCPSRATYLTGQYPHNHGVQGNHEPVGGYYRLDGSRTLPVWLRDAGYHTAHIGKYLNEYGTRQPTEVPPGWTEWYGAVDPSTYRYFDYRLNENGRTVHYGNRPEEYQSDVYTRKAVDFVHRRGTSEQPFFLSLAYLAPHSGFPSRGRCADSAHPAPRHAGDFRDAVLPRPPSFDEPDVSDKPQSVAGLPRLGPEAVERITRDYQCRRESLLAVDEGVRELVGALRETGELDRTLIVFTSDNGFFQGEHRVPKSKFKPYESSVRVPLVLRGPGVPPGTRIEGLTANVDLAPTLLDAAGAEPGHVVDGRSLLPVLAGRERLDHRAVLLENGPDDGRRNPQYDAVRTDRYVYVEYATGERELYDLRLDPHQLRSAHADPAHAPVRDALAGALAALRDCSGASCRVDAAVP